MSGQANKEIFRGLDGDLDKDPTKSTGTNHGFNADFFRRFWRIQGLLFPGPCALTVGLFGLVLLLALLEEIVGYAVGLIASGYYLVLGEKDFKGFIWQTLTSVGIILVMVLVKSVKSYISKVLNISWRQLLTRAIHRLYFSGTNYYQLNVLHNNVDNPDQRIAADVSILCSVYSLVSVKVLIAPFTISYYTYRAYTGTGWIGPTACFAFFLIGTLFNKLLMSPIVFWVVQQERREGDFRYKHMQIRSNAESLAFLTGGPARLEEAKSNRKLDSLLATQHSLYGRQLGLNLATNTFDYLGSIVSYLALAVPIFTGRYDNASSAELSSIISQNAFVCIYLIYSFSSLVDLSSSVTQLAGVTHRVAEMIERLHYLEEPQLSNESDEITCIIHDSSNNERHESKNIEGCLLEGAFFSAPGRSEDLIKDLSVHLKPGHSVLITGSSSAGKTSLLRVLRGLWRLSRGSLKVNHAPGSKGVLFLPQKPYLTDGSLREQITYPLSVEPDLVTEEETNNLLNYLKITRMDGLLERIGGLDKAVDWNWYDVLSPGEMQRLSFIRLLYHRPTLAFLDEATSALDGQMEGLLYSAAVELNVTLVSVGHRASLRAFHQSLLDLKGDGSWTLEPLLAPNNQ